MVSMAVDPGGPRETPSSWPRKAGLKGWLKAAVLRRAPGLWARWCALRKPASAETELLVLDAVVPPGSVTVDVGANVGLYARALARLSETVIAFEPLEDMVRVIKASAPANVDVRQLALSARPGTGALSIPCRSGRPLHSLASLSQGAAEAGERVSAPTAVSTLDAEIDRPVSFVKIDVEGHELPVVQGATALIEKHRPVFLVESEARHCDGAPHSLFSFFERLGYAGFFIMGDRLCGIAEFDTAAHQDASVLRRSGARRPGRYYINNFFFLPDRSGESRLRAALQAALSRRPGAVAAPS